MHLPTSARFFLAHAAFEDQLLFLPLFSLIFLFECSHVLIIVWTTAPKQNKWNSDPPGLLFVSHSAEFALITPRYRMTITSQQILRLFLFSTLSGCSHCICSDLIWADILAMWISHIWKIYIGSINSWLAVRKFWFTQLTNERITLVFLCHKFSVCASALTLNSSYRTQNPIFWKNKYQMILQSRFTKYFQISQTLS